MEAVAAWSSSWSSSSWLWDADADAAGADVMLPAAVVVAAAAEGAKVGSATPDGQCLSGVNALNEFSLSREIVPVVIVRFANTAGCGRDSVGGSLSSRCGGGLSNTSRAVPDSKLAGCCHFPLD